MMNSISKTVCALTVLATSVTTVWAVESVDLKVTGRIQPAACTPVISAGGVVDYGTILAANLNATSYNDLGMKKVDIALACDAPAKVAIQAISNRGDSVVSDSPVGPEGFAVAPIDLFGTSGVEAAGLGLDGANNKIGGYAARLVPGTSQADSTRVDTIISMDRGVTWNGTTTPNITSNTQILSWAQTGTILPIALKTLAAELEVNAYLNKAEELDLTQVVSLDGSSTIEVVYL